MKNLKDVVQEEVYQNVYEQVYQKGCGVLFTKIRLLNWGQFGVIIYEQVHAQLHAQFLLNEKS